MKVIKLKLIIFFLFFSLCSKGQEIYPLPSSLMSSSQFKVWIDKEEVPVWIADGAKKVTQFAYDNQVVVKVLPEEAYTNYSIHPLAYEIQSNTIGDTILITIDNRLKSKIVLRLDDMRSKELFILADESYSDIPDSGEHTTIPPGTHNKGDIPSTGTVIFEPGNHFFNGFSLTMECDHHVYLKPGAVLYTRILFGERVMNAGISGPGIIVAPYEGKGSHQIFVNGSGHKDIYFKDFTLTNYSYPGEDPNEPQSFPNAHQIVYQNGSLNDGLIVENVKTIADYVTSDAIDINGVSNVEIRNNFLTCADNTIVIGARGVCKNINVRDNVAHQIGGSSSAAFFPQGSPLSSEEASIEHMIVENFYIIDVWGGLVGMVWGNRLDYIRDFRIENAWLESDILCQENQFCEDSEILDLKPDVVPLESSDLTMRNIHWFEEDLPVINVNEVNWGIAVSNLYIGGTLVESLETEVDVSVSEGSSMVLNNNLPSQLPFGWTEKRIGSITINSVSEEANRFSIDVSYPTNLEVGSDFISTKLSGNGSFKMLLDTKDAGGSSGIALSGDQSLEDNYLFFGVDPKDSLIIKYDANEMEVRQRLIKISGLPIWLAIQKLDAELTTSYSYDGVVWESEIISLETPFETRIGMLSSGSAVFSDVESTSSSQSDLAPQSSFNCSIARLPGIIQVEDFDVGGENISYFDTDEGNSGGSYRLDTDVDIESTSDVDGAFDVVSSPTEWLEYSVDIRSGSFNGELRYSSINGGDLDIFINHQLITSVTLPATGSNSTYVTHAFDGLEIVEPLSIASLRLAFDFEGHVNSFSVVDGSGSAPIGKHIRLKSAANGYYVNIVRADEILYAIDDVPSDGQEFIVEDAGQGFIALYAVNNQGYVSSWQVDNPPTMRGKGSNIDTWEYLSWIDNEDGSISFLCDIAKQYISVDTTKARNPLVSDKTTFDNTTIQKFYWEEYDANDNEEIINILSISLPVSIDLMVGEQAQVTAEVKPDNATSNEVVWSSNDPDVATVSSEGVVTAMGIGETTVTLKGKKLWYIEDQINVVVTAPPILGLSENGWTLVVYPNPVSQGEGFKVLEGTEIANIVIVDATGKSIPFTKRNHHYFLDQTIPLGIYFLKVYLANGKSQVYKLLYQN